VQARTSTWTGSPEALEQWVAHVNAQVKPMVAGLPGSAGAYFFVDRATGSAMTLTLWETEAAAAASDAMAEASRARTIAATGIELVDRAAYDVLS